MLNIEVNAIFKLIATKCKDRRQRQANNSGAIC